MRTSLAVLAAAASVYAAPPVQESTTETIPLTAYGDGTDSIFYFQQFDTTLGTLEGVRFTIDNITLGGSFDVSSSGLTGALESFSSNIRVRQVPIATPAPDLGFPQYARNVDDSLLSLTDLFDEPVSLPLSLVQNENTTVYVSPFTVVSNRISNISSTYWANYQGDGFVALEFRNLAGVLQSGGVGSFDTTWVTADATITLNYFYTPAPIPEPSTYGLILGGLALAGAAVRRRQKAAK